MRVINATDHLSFSYCLAIRTRVKLWYMVFLILRADGGAGDLRISPVLSRFVFRLIKVPFTSK